MATGSIILAWRFPWTEATVHGVKKSQTQLSDSHFTFTLSALHGNSLYPYSMFRCYINSYIMNTVIGIKLECEEYLNFRNNSRKVEKSKGIMAIQKTLFFEN